MNTPPTITPEFANLFVEEPINPFRACIQGLANEPVTVLALLRRAEAFLRREPDFGQAAAGFDDVAVLAREAGKRLFESLDYLDDRQPEVILEVGCGTGHNAALLKKRWPRARVIARV